MRNVWPDVTVSDSLLPSLLSSVIMITHDPVISLTELSSIHYLHTYAQYLAKHANHKQSP